MLEQDGGPATRPLPEPLRVRPANLLGEAQQIPEVVFPHGRGLRLLSRVFEPCSQDLLFMLKALVDLFLDRLHSLGRERARVAELRRLEIDLGRDALEPPVGLALAAMADP